MISKSQMRRNVCNSDTEYVPADSSMSGTPTRLRAGCKQSIRMAAARSTTIYEHWLIRWRVFRVVRGIWSLCTPKRDHAKRIQVRIQPNVR
eukprot:5005264-Pleurochrysis_carterae.AAC.3